MHGMADVRVAVCPFPWLKDCGEPGLGPFVSDPFSVLGLHPTSGCPMSLCGIAVGLHPQVVAALLVGPENPEKEPVAPLLKARIRRMLLGGLGICAG